MTYWLTPLSTPNTLTDTLVGSTQALFAHRHHQGVLGWLQNSVAPTTRAQYKLTWTRWRLFLRAALPEPPAEEAPDEDFLFEADTTAEITAVAQYICMFTHHLATDYMLCAESCKNCLSALRYHFKTRCADLRPFDHIRVKTCRTALMKNPAYYCTKSRQTLPATLEMVDSLLKFYDSPKPFKMMMRAAIALAFCCLMRASEYVETRTAAHVLTAKQVLFEYQRSNGQSVFFNAANLPEKFQFHHCRSVKILFLTAKNYQIRNSHTIWFSTQTLAHIPLPRILFDWAKTAKLQPDDRFLSYRTKSTSRSQPLQYRRVGAAIKYAARKHGINPKHFSCHSLRVGGASHLRAAGATDGNIFSMGRWRSMPACLGYQASNTAINDRLLVLLGKHGVFTTRDVQLGSARSS